MCGGSGGTYPSNGVRATAMSTPSDGPPNVWTYRIPYKGLTFTYRFWVWNHGSVPITITRFGIPSLLRLRLRYAEAQDMAMDIAETRYAKTVDGVHIAFQTILPTCPGNPGSAARPANAAINACPLRGLSDGFHVPAP